MRWLHREVKETRAGGVEACPSSYKVAFFKGSWQAHFSAPQKRASIRSKAFWFHWFSGSDCVCVCVSSA